MQYFVVVVTVPKPITFHSPLALFLLCPAGPALITYIYKTTATIAVVHVIVK